MLIGETPGGSGGPAISSITSLLGVAPVFGIAFILVIEQVGVKDGFSRSAAAFKKTWGENVIGSGGIGLVMTLIMVAGVAATAPVVVVGMNTSNAPLTVDRPNTPARTALCRTYGAGAP